MDIYTYTRIYLCTISYEYMRTGRYTDTCVCNGCVSTWNHSRNRLRLPLYVLCIILIIIQPSRKFHTYPFAPVAARRTTRGEWPINLVVTSVSSTRYVAGKYTTGRIGFNINVPAARMDQQYAETVRKTSSSRRRDVGTYTITVSFGFWTALRLLYAIYRSLNNFLFSTRRTDDE